MLITNQLIEGTLIRRYKRFLADIKLSGGEVVIAHCTNSGSMKSCLIEGAPVLLSKTSNPKRKTQYTWEYIKINDSWVGVNTLLPNNLVHHLLQDQQIRGLKGYSQIKREVTVGESRIDFFLESGNNRCYVEVKNVSLRHNNFARFPDSVTKRGKKHLLTLMKLKEGGNRAVMLYIIQREDIEYFGPAWEIDPEYSKTLVLAANSGVEIIALKVKLSQNTVELSQEVETVLPI